MGDGRVAAELGPGPWRAEIAALADEVIALCG
jgi:hypothetical protein